MKAFILLILAFASALLAYSIGYTDCIKKLTTRLLKADELADIVRNIINFKEGDKPELNRSDIEITLSEYEASKNE